MLKYLNNNEINIFKVLKMAKEGKAKTLSEKELKRVVQHQKTANHSFRNIALLHFSFFLGLRAKEMSSLMINDVVEASGQLRDQIVLKREMTKGNKQRTVYLANAKLRKSLQEYLDFRKNEENSYFYNGPLFRSQISGKFSPNSLQQLFSRMYQSVGIEGASSHSGRRSFATKLLNQGINIRNVQQLLGHQNITTTSIYIDTNPKMLSEICENLKI